jgi:hypothetical protein
VSGLSYGWTGAASSAGLGDRYRQIPPFTGNGMTIALEAAQRILPHAIAYANDEMSWEEFLQKQDDELLNGFNRRYLMANILHPFLLKPMLQSLLCKVARAHLVPFSTIYRLTHN